MTQTRSLAGSRAAPAAIHAAVVAAALLLTFVAFGSGLSAEFVSDDLNCIVENEHVVGPLDVAGIFSEFSWWGTGRADSPGYRPLVTLSFALNHEAVGLTPFAYHVTNFVLHAVVTWLVFALGLALGLATAGAAAAALLFCVLPIHSEAVVWVVGRAELGAAIGFLLAVWLVVLYRRSGSVAMLVAGAVAMVCGALCKENALTAVAAPLVLALVLPPDSAVSTAPAAAGALRRQWQRHRRDITAAATLSAAAALYIAMRVAAAGFVSEAQAQSALDNPLSMLALGRRWLGALSILGRYLWLTLAGGPLSVDYSYDALAIHEGFAGDRYAFVAVATASVLTLAAWKTRRSVPVIAAGLLLAAAAYSIVSNLVFLIGTIAGERLFYLPSAGLCLAAGAALNPLLGKPSVRRAAVATMLALACAGWLVQDRRRAAEWRDPISLFEAAVATMPRSARAHMELASAYGRKDHIDEARSHFEAALAIKPDYAAAAYNFGNTLARAGRFDDAVAQYRRAIQSDARLTRAWHNLALVYRIQGKSDAWLEALAASIRSAPQNADLHVEYAEALLGLGRNQEAIGAYDEAIARGAGTAAAYFNRAVAKHRLGGCQRALEDYRAAASLPAAPAAVLQALQGCLLELGRKDEAESLGRSGKVANRDTRR